MAPIENPVLPGCHPDPSICRVGERYYLVTSTFEYFPGLPVFTSTDLAHWELIGHALHRPGQLDLDGIPSSGGLYAPTLRHHDGRFWLVCTLVDPRDPTRGGNFLLTATEATGPWSDPVWLAGDGIDPSLFFDDDGRVWLHGTRLAANPEWPQQTQVWLREFDPVRLVPFGPETVIWTGALRGAVWAEGPHLYRVNHRYYLLAAEGGTDFHHAVCVARADQVTGPYVGNPANPVLTHRHLGREVDVTGTGHADLVRAGDGTWWAVLLGMRPEVGYHYPLGRETFLVPVSWAEGWPVFAPGVGRVPALVEVDFAAAGPRSAAQGGGCGPIGPDDLRWTSLRGPATGFAIPSGEGWRLRLLPQDLTQPGTPAFLGVRQQHRHLDLAVSLDPSLAEGEEAGLVVRQSEDDHVRFAIIVAAGAKLARVVQRRGGVDQVLGELGLDDGEPVLLHLRMRGGDGSFDVTMAGRQCPVAGFDANELDSVATGGFLGLWLGIYATSNGLPTASAVIFERFDYRPCPGRLPSPL